MVTTIGIDPHEATRTADAIDRSEMVLGEVTVAADRDQVKRLVDWAGELDGDGRLWAVEAAGVSYSDDVEVHLERRPRDRES